MNKSQQHGKCIFCDGHGLSKQHVWPDWLKNVIPRNYDVNVQELTKYNPSSTNKEIINTQFIEKQGHMGSRKIRNVCEKCNNGWMSDLEQKVKTFLTSMILGKRTTLNSEEQTDLSSWVIMTSIMAEYTDLKTQSISNLNRKNLYKNLKPPKGWQIWVGKYKGEDWGFRYKHHGAQFYKKSEFKMSDKAELGTTCNTQFSTFVIGDLFVHCLSSQLEPINFDTQSFDKFLENHLLKIWPLQIEKKITWPPNEIIGDELTYAINIKFETYFKGTGD